MIITLQDIYVKYRGNLIYLVFPINFWNVPSSINYYFSHHLTSVHMFFFSNLYIQKGFEKIYFRFDPFLSMKHLSLINIHHF